MFLFRLIKTSAALAALVLFSTAVFAQSENVTRLSGRVFDALSKEPLIQAVIVVKVDGRSDQAALSDLDGFYGIDLQQGKVEVVVSYVGYEAMTRTLDVGNQTIKLNFALETTVLKEARVVADMAIERETPVAFSNIKPLQIQEELGSQPIPMILNSTPGVYASQEGSEDTGPSVTIRGFKQRNVSVMVDGIPVNSMESGSVYWNNWRGLDLVTETMQVQRGLGASKLALPAIGGTINIMTKGIESEKKLTYKQEGGSFGMFRSSLAINTGKNEKGCGFTGLGSIFRQGEIYQSAFQKSWFYYGKLSKSIGRHVLSFSAVGSPATQSRRGFQQRIATLDPQYARNLFKGTNEEYQHMHDYLESLTAITNAFPPLGVAEKREAIRQLNQAYGYQDYENAPNPTQAFEEHMSQTDFIDTTGLMSFGRDYNVHWGYRNEGLVNEEKINERVGRSHQPLLFLRHAMDVSDRVYWSTTLYSATARVGSVRLDPFLGAGDYSSNGQIDFDTFYLANTEGTNPLLGPNYSQPDSLLISSIILREANTNFFWLGGLSTMQAELSEKLILSGGVDLRTYRGESYATVYDLLGGAVVQDGIDWIQSGTQLHTTTKATFGGQGHLGCSNTKMASTTLSLTSVQCHKVTAVWITSPKSETKKEFQTAQCGTTFLDIL